MNTQQIEEIARIAYGYFIGKYPRKHKWDQLPEVTRIKWRNDVAAVEKVHSRTAGSFPEQCIRKALDDRKVPEATAPVIESALDTPPKAVTRKFNKPIKEGSNADN